jgi:hypothetical protein
MPQLINSIDKIARDKKRGVLFLEFHPDIKFLEDEGLSSRYVYQNDVTRQLVIDKLDELGVSWCPCAQLARNNLMMSYRGQIYLDLPYDAELPLYRQVEEFLEDTEGKMRFDTVRFYYLPLEIAMQNAYQDEPGYWEEWAEDL